MAQKRIGFEWLIGDETFDLRPFARKAGNLAYLHRPSLEPQGTAGSRLFSTEERRVLTRALRTLALLFVLVTASGAAFTQRELSIAHAYKGIEFALQREHLAWQSSDRVLFAELIDPEVDTYWEREWRAYWQADASDPTSYQVILLNVFPLDVE